MYVCQQIASQTGGEYGAAENESHFLELLKARLQVNTLILHPVIVWLA